ADVYNGTKATNWWNFKNDISCYISYDQKTWEAIKTSRLPDMELLVEFVMKAGSVYVARIPPYTISDLENLKSRIVTNKLVKIFNIGMTVEKRPLEIIQLGNPDAPNSVIIRARAHSWEPGGSWVVEGLINKFISENSKKWQETFCVYIMPMANKDGVARGMTRFNMKGKDLNRNWDKMSDPVLCPEKYALEKFIISLINKGNKPCFGIDIHNDDGGGIILATHSKEDTQFVKNMQFFEKLMREHTSFSENVRYSWKTAGQPLSNVSFENGLLERYGIEAIVYELNANWISSLTKMPSAKDWMEIGENLNDVFYEYLNGLTK
ncbi:MAG TPA: M14 family zinc carboxypeptidase, partial [Anaerovoracaceae bacterium]|nr:M14 family zinc carboxypeptidase [Anaerovoracaceae bacterium]